MSGDKTEQPTAKKLRDARKKGQVPNSKELVSSALILAFLGLLVGLAGSLVQRFQSLISMPVPFLSADFPSAADTLLAAYAREIAAMTAPFLLLVVVVAIAANTGQFGLLLAADGVKPSLDKLNPAKWFKKTFGMENLIEFLKSLIKIAVLSLVLFFLIRDGLQAMIRAPSCGIPCLRSVLGSLLLEVVLWSAGPFIIVAAADVAFQRWNFRKQNMMSKDEIKREYKEAEGDPQVKGMRKQLHQQMLAEGKVDRSRSATVLVTNPTHVAVAVLYRQGETPLPVVTAIGTDLVARRMMEAAAGAGVPIMRDVPLARALLETGQVDQYIPSELIEPFAEVLRALQNIGA